MAKNTTEENSCSEFPTNDALSSNRASLFAISSRPCGIPALTKRIQRIIKPRTMDNATTKLITNDTFRAVHGSTFLITLLTRLTLTTKPTSHSQLE